MERTPLTRRLTAMQAAVVDLIGVLQSYAEIGALLQLSAHGVRRHAVRAAAKMPGDLPTYTRCLMWVRGASLDALTGGSHRAAILGGTPQRRRARSAEVDATEAKLAGLAADAA